MWSLNSITLRQYRKDPQGENENVYCMFETFIRFSTCLFADQLLFGLSHLYSFY